MRPVEAAFALLARRDHTRWELAQKLLRRGFDETEVAAALDRCGELGYLDDAAFAERFVATRAVRNGWGPLRLTAELERRGIDRELAESASDLDDAVYHEALMRALSKLEQRRKPGWFRVPQQRSRMVSSLLGCGFDAETAIQAVDDLVRQRETSDHAFEIE
jgi:regulatory protein